MKLSGVRVLVGLHEVLGELPFGAVRRGAGGRLGRSVHVGSLALSLRRVGLELAA